MRVGLLFVTFAGDKEIRTRSDSLASYRSLSCRIVCSRALSICVLATVGSGLAQAPAPAAQPVPLNIAGDWTGNWSSYNPAKGAESSKELCAKLDAKVAAGKDGVWEATFTGDCGRPYQLHHQDGRAAGGESRAVQGHGRSRPEGWRRLRLDRARDRSGVRRLLHQRRLHRGLQPLEGQSQSSRRRAVSSRSFPRCCSSAPNDPRATRHWQCATSAPLDVRP